MKRFIITLIASFVLPLPLHAEDRDAKAELAITYLKRIAKGELDIAKHTALSPNCSIARRKIIRNRLNLVQSEYLRVDDTLTVEAVKDGDQFSAILIRAEHPSSPLSSRVLAVALLRKKDGWQAAPLPGSFANTAYGYDEDVEKNVKALETWMALEKIKREVAYREKAANKFDASLAEIEKELQLEKLSAQKSVTHFIELCRSKNLMHILAAMGAASGELPESLEDTISTITRGLEISDLESDWQVVTNKSCVYEVLNVDEKRSEIAVGFYNPMLRRQSKVLYFPIKKQDNKTFVRLSPMLTIALLPQQERWQQRWRHRRDDERKLILTIPATILKNTTAKAVESPEKLLDTFLSALKYNNFRNAIELLPRKGHHFEEDKEQTIVLANLASLWQDLVGIKSSAKPKTSIAKDSLLALAPLQFAVTNQPGRFRTVNLWMLKSDSGWQLIPENSIKSVKDAKLRESMKTLERKIISMTQVQQKEISKKLLSQVFNIDPANLKAPVSEQDAAALFKQYRGHLRSDDHQAALSCCAVLKGTDGTRTLKNLSYALRGVNDHINDDRTLGVTTRGNWSGISVRTQSRLAGTNDYPLHLCLKTSKGPKILLDIDLRHATNNGRKSLNNTNWKILEEAIPAETLKDVKAIFAQHEKLVAADIEAEKKLHE